MGLKAKVFVVVFMTSCMIQLTICNPIEAKEKDKIAEDPCKLTDLENIPECNKNHTECDEESKIKLEKLHKLCETYPSCKNCETLILESEEELVAPEIVEPIEINLDSTDDLGSPSRRLVERNIIIENDNETQYYRGYVESAANITTVIRLTNLINNTNIINMPTTLNNTNINNIHIYQNKSSETGGKYGLGYSEKGSCCYAVQPRGCMQSTSGLKCRHKRHKVCGRQCTHKVIHPNRNPCTSTQQWPYVLCPPNNGYSNNYNPGYYPPNYPQYYPPNNPQYYPPNNPGYYPQNPVFDQPDDDDDDDFPMFPDEEELNNPESGWIVSPEKCKVVSEDGLQITNCTQKGHDFDNPFARNSISEPSKRNVRQTKKNHHQQIPYPNQMMQQPMQFYPMMYQPVYVQPMPIFMPQFYQQPPLNYPVNNYQPQQIPFPPMDQYDSYEEDQESNKIHEQPKKHFRKNKHVVMEIDEEL